MGGNTFTHTNLKAHKAGQDFFGKYMVARPTISCTVVFVCLQDKS